jgi:pyruvyltransferase
MDFIDSDSYLNTDINTNNKYINTDTDNMYIKTDTNNKYIKTDTNNKYIKTDTSNKYIKTNTGNKYINININNNKLAIYTTCDDNYVKYAIVALKQFQYYNNGYDAYIISSYISNDNVVLCNSYDINIKIIDLSNYFTNLEDRSNQKYPIECYYIFYGPVMLYDYRHIVYIDGDVYTNKKLKINFNNVKNILAFKTNVIIKNFLPIKKSINLIGHIINKPTLNKNRFNTGVIIFNCKNVNNNNFFKDVIKLYKIMINKGNQLCGDDSLFTLYYLHRPDMIEVSSEYYNYYNAHGETNPSNIFLFHFIGLSKPWIKGDDIIDFNNNTMQKYFRFKWIESLYTNFNENFIYTYFPQFIYPKDININYKFYYFNKELNFGDLITPYINNKFCNRSFITYVDENYTGTKIISTGSIIRLCNSNTIVYGSGIRDRSQQINNGLIISVRGPYTYNNFNKNHNLLHCEYGDPGLLMSLFYNPPIKKKYNLGIVPHYVDYENVLNMYKNNRDVRVINLLNSNIEKVINEMLSCKYIISSSLHGLIVSDAYNIPNMWIKYDNKIKGDDTKFHDYFESVNIKKRYIDARLYKYITSKHLINIIISSPQVNYNHLKEIINNIYKNMYFNKNGIKNFTKYLYYNNLCKNSIVGQIYLCNKTDFIFQNNKIISKNNTNIINFINNTAITIPKNIIFNINNDLQYNIQYNNDFWAIIFIV